MDILSDEHGNCTKAVQTAKRSLCTCRSISFTAKTRDFEPRQPKHATLRDAIPT
jgi:hypothetical protein